MRISFKTLHCQTRKAQFMFPQELVHDALQHDSYVAYCHVFASQNTGAMVRSYTPSTHSPLNVKPYVVLRTQFFQAGQFVCVSGPRRS